ncbi:MAG TPA: hypothetical protein VNE63_13005 [Candidatus Acidoferrales bacterium]|nr:hypothetical protein [Candidatus Acidoferrales bacterium]
MSNQSFLSIWCKDFPEERMLDRFGAFLAIVPFSTTKPGFTHLTIRAVDGSEAPMLEQDFRTMPVDAPSIVVLAQDYLHSDSCYEVHCYWDLWKLDAGGRWKMEPERLEIFCHGTDYDGGLCREYGHLEVNFGFEHLFTGHAGLLGIRQKERAAAESPEEARFLEAMAWPENLQKYHEKTRENIRKLLDWVRRIEKTLPVERARLWSEGEENFEARLEEILAAH